jgi:hypothetical protein
MPVGCGRLIFIVESEWSRIQVGRRLSNERDLPVGS